MATVPVTDATFGAEVINSPVPVVVDFWAEWCGPCRMIGPALEELSTQYGDRVKIAKVNVDENPNTAAQLGVRGIPALFVFKDGKPVSNRAGAAPKAAPRPGADRPNGRRRGGPNNTLGCCCASSWRVIGSNAVIDRTRSARP